MQRCNDMILACKWQGQTVPCTELFQVRRTDNGFCCSFNTINIDEQLQVQSIFLDFCKTHIIYFQTIFSAELEVTGEDDESDVDGDGASDYYYYYYDGDPGQADYFDPENYGDYFDNFGEVSVKSSPLG